MTVLTPPRPLRVDGHRDRSPVEALREHKAPMEEARRRARRRRQRYAALALLGITSVLAIVLGRVSGGYSNGASTMPGAPMHIEAAAARQGKSGRTCAIGASWSRDGTKLAFYKTARRTPVECAAVVMTIITLPDRRKIAVAVTRTAEPS